MPSTSDKQRRFFGLVLALKRGEAGKGSKKAKDTAERMSEGDIKDFSKKTKMRGIASSLMNKGY